MIVPLRQVRAVFDEDTITVYQAYSDAIADAALAVGRFAPPFSRDRMTWIKPSFLWMMYRCGWATKPGQERVLAVRITRTGFEDALARACLSHFDPEVYPDHDGWLQRKATSPVRVQWDPERDLQLAPLPWRSLQVGLGGDTVARYVDSWTVDLTDITETVRQLRDEHRHENPLLPVELPYPLPPAVAATVGAGSPLRRRRQLRT